MPLNPGDIAFVQYNADGTDNFSFVGLVDIPAYEEIRFTDNGWLSDDSGFRAGEGIIIWVAPSDGITAGTVVTITTTPSASPGTITEMGILNLASEGDQLTAYQESGPTITPIAALNNEGAGLFQADATSSNTSALPQGLTVGTDAVALSEVDNAVYVGPTDGEKSALLAALNDSSNWSGSNTVNQTFSGRFTIECFLTGTHILTEYGDVPVEELKRGDRVLTAAGTVEPIKWIGRQTCEPNQIQNPLRGYPIQINAGALGHGLPHRDLFFSPDHALLVDGMLINAGALVNGISILKTIPSETFIYHHIELDQHALLVAEGTAAESYLPQKEDRASYDNGAEYEDLYPHNGILCYWPMAYPRVSSIRQLPQFVSKRLMNIARHLTMQPIDAHQNLRHRA